MEAEASQDELTFTLRSQGMLGRTSPVELSHEENSQQGRAHKKSQRLQSSVSPRKVSISKE